MRQQERGLARGSMQRCSGGLAYSGRDRLAMGLWIAPTAGAQLLDSASESPTADTPGLRRRTLADAAFVSPAPRWDGRRIRRLSLIREGDTSVKLGGWPSSDT